MGARVGRLAADMIAQRWNIPPSNFVLSLDCLAAGRTAIHSSLKLPPGTRQADLVRELRADNAGPLHATFHHVKGHQDDHTLYQDLSREAQLNVQCDAAAKQDLLEWATTDDPAPHWTPVHTWSY